MSSAQGYYDVMSANEDAGSTWISLVQLLRCVTICSNVSELWKLLIEPNLERWSRRQAKNCTLKAFKVYIPQ